jgi:hypothetical protein
MNDDPIWRGLLVVAVLIFLMVALYPDLVIKVLSYGRKTTQDVDRNLLIATRIMAAIGVIYGVAYIAWGIVRK